MLETPGAMIRLEHGLALAYSQCDGIHHLALSRVGVYPGENEVQIVLNVLAGLGADPLTIQRKMDSQDKHKIFRLSWPVATQPRMF